MKNKNSFKRLKGAASIGLLAAAGGVQAANATFPLTVTRSRVQDSGVATVKWQDIGNGFINTDAKTSSGAPVPSCISRIFGSAATVSSVGNMQTDAGLQINGCGNQAFGIHNNRYNPGLVGGRASQYQNLFSLLVENALFVNPDNDVDVTDNVVTSDVGTMSGADVQVQYKFFGVGDVVNGRIVTRAMFSFTNTTAADLDINAKVMSKLSSFYRLIDSSNGDTVSEDSDTWIIGNQLGDEDEPSEIPNILLSRHGEGAEVSPVNTIASTVAGNFVTSYSLSIPVGETVRLVSFSEMTKTNADASSNAQNYNDITSVYEAGLFEGLSKTEISETVNYMPVGYDVNDLDAADAPKEKVKIGAVSSLFLSLMLSLGFYRKARK